MSECVGYYCARKSNKVIMISVGFFLLLLQSSWPLRNSVRGQ